MGKLIDLTGKRFGRWIVLEKTDNKSGKVAWLCKCDCGTKKKIIGNSLKRGDSKSCGCLLLSFNKEKKTHGLTKNKLYKVHNRILSRCNNKKDKGYKHYGGRGITVCDEWLDKNDGVKNFIEWAESNGYEDGLEIDRIDNDGNYEPSNCRFTTRRENVLNQRLKANNTSGYEGISFLKNTKKWKSEIQVEKKRFRLGCFKTKQEALEARNNYIKDNNLEHEYTIQEWRGDE